VLATPLMVPVLEIDRWMKDGVGLAKFRDAPRAGILNNWSKLDPRDSKTSRRQTTLPQMSNHGADTALMMRSGALDQLNLRLWYDGGESDFTPPEIPRCEVRVPTGAAGQGGR
jgi:hypothetical protein